ncbi:hypothetical protein B0G80_0244 [Paraburkholderia sp. BL6669N2]|uniref:hypothetical protein n=1 Tax=Paraburkholderia sp. BL6669N2 TaxID=1938807 RepID=UPI000E23AB38|nr:hypothetical protein [Paraburkholderia sp. BL6669N2]REG57620.1 hypothetical protein B0G80_0244 [Paraburkholderia sp. BL6669N2]
MTNELGAAARSGTKPLAESTLRDRLTRDGVKVTLLHSGEARTYRSTREAFQLLHLPDSKHVKFRMGLKAERVRDWTDEDGRVYRFELVPLNK